MAGAGPVRLGEMLKKRTRADEPEITDLCESDEDVAPAPTPSKRARPVAPVPSSSVSSSSSKGKGREIEVIDVDDDVALPLWSVSPVLPQASSSRAPVKPVAGPSRPRPSTGGAATPSQVDQLLALFPGLDRDEARKLLADPKAVKHGASAVNAVADHLFSLNGEVRSVQTSFADAAVQAPDCAGPCSAAYRRADRHASSGGGGSDQARGPEAPRPLRDLRQGRGRDVRVSDLRDRRACLESAWSLPRAH